MPVNKIGTRKPIVTRPPALVLPTLPKVRDEDFSHYTTLLYGREKIGKTTVAASWPEAIFFSCEPGTKGLEVYELNAEKGGVKSWEIFREGVSLLEKNPGKFQSVILDTVDRAYDMCMDYVCKTRGIEYPGVDNIGREDFGKSWRAVKQEFIDCIHRISQSGRGILFVSHAKESDVQSASGSKYTIIHPTYSGQAKAVVEALVDFIFYAEYVKDTTGTTRRILVCQGDECVRAGARQGIVADFPKFLPMEREGEYDIILKAFTGEYTGLDAKTLLPTNITSEVGKNFIQRSKIQASKVAPPVRAMRHVG
jgi:hypothetical protein